MRSLEELATLPRVDNTPPNDATFNRVGGLIELLQSIPRPKLAVEVGCYRGVSTETLLHFCDHVIAVDPWEWIPAHQAGRDFRTRLKDEPTLSVLKKQSVHAAKLFDNGVLDFVYIDAAHELECVRADLVAWTRTVKYGGHVGGHDYTPLISQGGVIAAVNKWFAPDRVKTFPDSSWLVKL